MKTLIVLMLCLAAFSFTAQAQFTILKHLESATTGKSPYGDLVFDGTYLYGMASSGGANTYFGTIFKIKPDGTGFVKLFDFDLNNTGRTPLGSLVTDGTYLYGMTQKGGGASSGGAIFKIKNDGTGFVNMENFSGDTTGYAPLGSLLSDGTYLYGMTSYGGTHNYGTIFKIKMDGTGFSKLLDFDYVPNGGTPGGTLIMVSGFLYGMTEQGGNGSGTIFKIMPDGTGFVKLHSFDGTTTNGGNSNGSLVSDGTYLYGMVPIGGVNGVGALFKMKLDGTGYTQIHDFAGTTNGIHGSLIVDGSNLYGMLGSDSSGSYGSIFMIHNDGTGYTKLHVFAPLSNGGLPNGSLISDGVSLYGMTFKGGSNDDGTIFKMKYVTTGVGDHSTTEGAIPQSFTLSQNYPNPFNPSTTIRYTLSVESHVQLTLSNLLGQQIRIVTNATEQAGEKSVQLDASGLPSGIYYYRLDATSTSDFSKHFSETRKMLLIR